MLAKDDAMPFYTAIIIFLFEAWNFWVGRARETTNQVEVALAKIPHKLNLHSLWELQNSSCKFIILKTKSMNTL